MECFAPFTRKAVTWAASIFGGFRYASTKTAETPRSIFVATCHPLVDQVSQEVDEYFLKFWPFPDEKSRKKFVAAGFSRVTCLYFPLSKDDRIGHACRILTLLFLIDDVLEDMSFEEGAAYNAKLMPLAKGTASPDRSVPVEYMMYDFWQAMRKTDGVRTDAMLEPMFEFMRSQTDKARGREMGLGDYFRYRERDVGRALLSGLMCFCMGISLSKEEKELVHDIDMNCSKHLAVINDIWSFEKELAAAKTGHEEGGVLCSSVSIVADEATISYSAAKRTLYTMCREWELAHVELISSLFRRCDSPSLRCYVNGLEYQMSGNEVWSKTTARYQKEMLDRLGASG